MNRIRLKHLHWVLLWLLLVDVLGEDGVTKAEKHLLIKQESGPKGGSLVRSFVSTRVSRAFTSTSSFDDGRRTDKPPDERQSTTRLRNDTDDLAKNTVPVLKYPTPTESSRKEKYQRTATTEATQVKKNLKLKRNNARPRPSDLTTLLVYNALTPGRYPSTTQVAESIPPTAWALATLKGPGPASNVKPFVSWSTRLSRPTTLSPISDLPDTVTEIGTVIQQEGIDITSPGNEDTEITAVTSDDITSPVSSAEPVTILITTEKQVDVTAIKPEENTISVPPLSSFKNITDDVEGSSDISPVPTIESQKNIQTEILLKNSSKSFLDEVPINSVTTSGKNGTLSIPVTSVTSKRLNNNNFATPESTFSYTTESSTFVPNNTENLINKDFREIDPSINTINEKKIEDPISTSTVISAVNSTVTVHIPSSTSKNINWIDIDQKLSGDEVNLAKKLPLTTETTTPSYFASSSMPSEAVDQDSSHNETNQTINDIKIASKTTKATSHSSEMISLETPSTLRSNEIKPEPVSSNVIKNSNVTEFKIESLQNDVQDFSETTQSNDIQVQEQIKTHNSTYIEHVSSDNSSFSQKLPNDTESVLTTMPSLVINNNNNNNNAVLNISLPSITDTSEYILQNTTTVNSMTTTDDHNVRNSTAITQNNSMFNDVTIGNNNFSLGSNVPVLFNESTFAAENSSSTVTITTPMPSPSVIANITDSAVIITSLSPFTVNTSILNNSSNPDINYVTSATPSITSTNTPLPSTLKPTDIKDKETVTELHQLLPEVNGTNLDSDNRTQVKNDTSVFRDGDEGDDDETLSFNHTEISDKKNQSDSISNHENEEDSDDLLETISNYGNLSSTVANVSKETTSSVTHSSTERTTTTSSDEATIMDEDRSNIDDDTIYDTGVIMTVYVRLLIQATYHDLCKSKELLKESIVKVFKNYAERTINKRQVVITNLGNNECSGVQGEMEPRLIPVHIMLTNSQGQYDKNLNDLFISLARRKQIDFKYPISQVDKVQQETLLETESQISGTMVAAIIISSIAAVCLFALTVLLVIMRKRQTGFNYGQRCTPVSLDDYSLDNISVYSSVRRKAIRASKRSYGNPAFDDPDVTSNPVNFAGLANMAADKSKIEEEFSSIPQVVVRPDELPSGTETKNRYANVIPIPETRVQLRGTSTEDQFINANYVKGAKGVEKFYIACQAPLQNSIEDFWRMIWDEQSRLIIMLTALTENGVEKCADYLPPSEVLDCHRVFGDLQVTLKKREAREKYVISSLQLKNLETNLWREVTHMWYAGWPPTGVPPEPSSVIAFLIEARSYSKSSPIVVHCSPGTGRTGTIITIDIAIRDFEAGRCVDIPKTVVQVRRGRAGAVQTKDQYSFIYKVLHLYATKLTGGGLDSI